MTTVSHTGIIGSYPTRKKSYYVYDCIRFSLNFLEMIVA